MTMRTYPHGKVVLGDHICRIRLGASNALSGVLLFVLICGMALVPENTLLEPSLCGGLEMVSEALLAATTAAIFALITAHVPLMLCSFVSDDTLKELLASKKVNDD